MWPAALNMSRDECRRTLRRLELEAYGAAVSALRAQGGLEDRRKKVLEELRTVLHVGPERHAAEARRAANDELLATVADTLSGPNTGMGWISEGRRRVPLMPRGIPQTAYTELADKIALQTSAENEELRRKLEAEHSVAPRSNEDSEMADAEGEASEGAMIINLDDEMLYPPIVMEDQSIKLLEMEVFNRKRKVPEGGALPDDLAASPKKNIKNSKGTQKHLNLSQIYSNYSKPHSSANDIRAGVGGEEAARCAGGYPRPNVAGGPAQYQSAKIPSQAKHLYNQVGKLSNKSNTTPSHSHTPHSERSEKPRSRKQSHGKSRESKSKMKSHSPHHGKHQQHIDKHQHMDKHQQHMDKHNMDTPLSSKYNLEPYKTSSLPIQLDYAGPPGTFQASYAQSIQLLKPSLYGDDAKSQQSLTDSPTMQLLTQPSTVPHEVGVNQQYHTDDPSSLQAQSTPSKHSTISGKACHLIIKKKPPASYDPKHTGQKVPMSEIKVLQQPKENVKLLPKKQFIVAPNSTQKAVNVGKLLPTKYVPKTPTKGQLGHSPHTPEKLVVVSGNSPSVQRSLPSSKNVILTSSNVTTPISKDTVTVDTNNISPKTADSTPKHVFSSDLKMPAKTFVLNPKSGQKMVVLPAKARAKTTLDGQTMPLIHFKGMPTTMKLVPVGSQSPGQISKTSSGITFVSRPPMTNTVTTTNTKIVSIEALKTTKSQETVSTPQLQGFHKIVGTPIMRQSTTKGNMIVVQKGTPLGKTLSLTKNGSEMSKVVMGKNVNQLIQNSPQKQDSATDSKNAGNIIVLDLNDQLGSTTTMSEILESHSTKAKEQSSDRNKVVPITEDTPVLFDTEETCNANSMDSLTDSTVDMAQIDEGTISSIDKEDESKSQKDLDSAKDTLSVTDWEIELRKQKGNDSGGSLNLELCMSSDSETDGYLVKSEKAKKPSQREAHDDGPSEAGMFSERGGLTHASRTLLSQLQDEGSSSNDSSFTLKSKIHMEKTLEKKSTLIDKMDTKSEKKSPLKSQSKRMDMFSSADIHLDSFEYLSEEGMMAGDDMFNVGSDGKRVNAKDQNLEMQLSQLLGDNVSSDTNNVSEMPLNK